MLAQYRKATTAIIGAIVTILAVNGVDLDPELVASVTTLITAVLVFAVPNED
jgi:CBS-domain-containing membrane protein